MNKLSVYILVSYFLIGALWKGLIYDTSFLVMNAFMAFILLLVWIRTKEHRMQLQSVLLLATGLLYLISVLYAVDRENALLESLKVLGIVPVAILAGWLDSNGRVRVWKSWIWTGTAVTALGVALGMERKGRLESTFEYANALSIFLLVALLFAVHYYVHSGEKKYIAAISVLTAGLLLAMTRSVWILWLPAVAMLAIPIAAGGKWRSLLGAAAGQAGGYLIASIYSKNALFFLERLHTVRTDTPELQIRTVYWKDSLGILADYWLGGTGGGGWSVLLFQYQTQDYFVKYVHNSWLQIALDIGVTGFLLFMGLIVFYVWCGIWSRNEAEHGRVVLLAVAVLLAHSFIDFNLSFPVLFSLLAVLISDYKGKSAFTPRLPRLIYLTSISLAVLFVAVNIWLLTGYANKLAGMNLSQAGRYEEAQDRFDQAERWLPWSHTVRYESAKNLIVRGNHTGNQDDYRLAGEQLEHALGRLKVKLPYYQKLLEDTDYRKY
jgi:hypothetical protein